MMVNGLVAVTQAGLVILLGMLGVRMFSLIRHESTQQIGVMAGAGTLTAPTCTPRPVARKEPTPAFNPTDKTELFSRLHILAGLQERDCRVQGLMLSGAPEPVQECAAAWLYGAACALTPRSQRHTEALSGIVARIISRKIGTRQPEAIQAIATLTSSTLLLACYRAGLEGAEFWQVHQYVPARASLHEVVTSNAFI